MSALEKDDFQETKSAMIESIRQKDLQIAFMGIKNDLKDMFNDFKSEIRKDIDELKKDMNNFKIDVTKDIESIRAKTNIIMGGISLIIGSIVGHLISLYINTPK